MKRGKKALAAARVMGVLASSIATHPVVGNLALLIVLQVERINIEGIDQEATVADVEG